MNDSCLGKEPNITTRTMNLDRALADLRQAVDHLEKLTFELGCSEHAEAVPSGSVGLAAGAVAIGRAMEPTRLAEAIQYAPNHIDKATERIHDMCNQIRAALVG